MRILENLLHLWVAFVDILFLLFGTVLGCSCSVVCCGLSASLLSGCFLLCRMGGERLMDLSEWRAFCGGATFPHDTSSWWSSVPALGDFVSCLSVQFCLGALHSPRNRKKKRASRKLTILLASCLFIGARDQDQPLGKVLLHVFFMGFYFRESCVCLTVF